jgi:hypothetical protein
MLTEDHPPPLLVGSGLSFVSLLLNASVSRPARSSQTGVMCPQTREPRRRTTPSPPNGLGRKQQRRGLWRTKMWQGLGLVAVASLEHRQTRVLLGLPPTEEIFGRWKVESLRWVELVEQCTERTTPSPWRSAKFNSHRGHVSAQRRS